MTGLKLGAACKLKSAGEDVLYFIEDISSYVDKDKVTIPTYTLATQLRNRIFTTKETPIPLDARGRMIRGRSRM